MIDPSANHKQRVADAHTQYGETIPREVMAEIQEKDRLDWIEHVRGRKAADDGGSQQEEEAGDPGAPEAVEASPEPEQQPEPEAPKPRKRTPVGAKRSTARSKPAQKADVKRSQGRKRSST